MQGEEQILVDAMTGASAKILDTLFADGGILEKEHRQNTVYLRLRRTDRDGFRYAFENGADFVCAGM